MSPQDTLRLVGEAIVEAAAFDGDRTAVDATVWQRGDTAHASLDLTIGGWFAGVHGTASTPDDAVADCLRVLDGALAHRTSSVVTIRVRAALAAALEAP